MVNEFNHDAVIVDICFDLKFYILLIKYQLQGNVMEANNIERIQEHQVVCRLTQ